MGILPFIHFHRQFIHNSKFSSLISSLKEKTTQANCSVFVLDFDTRTENDHAKCKLLLNVFYN